MNSDIKQLSLLLYNHLQKIYSDPPFPLHRPIFSGNEKEYLTNCIDSNFVSSVGAQVSKFESEVAKFVGGSYGIATVNGTAALHTSLLINDIEAGDEIITQALTFVATSNAIAYVGAKPIFVDVDKDTLGMSPIALKSWLLKNTFQSNGQTYNLASRARISACIPTHTFGFPCRIEEIALICQEFNLVLVEDTAESLGSFSAKTHTGNFGSCSAFSFNGNKIITTGGGGMIVTNDPKLANKAKHLTTTAKCSHPYEFFHDQVGYNYRLPNINAAIGLAQMENIFSILESKRKIAVGYQEFCVSNNLKFVHPRENTETNFWLNAIILKNREQRDLFLKETNKLKIMTRPIWRLMTELPMYQQCENDGLINSKWLVERVINLPSSVPESDPLKEYT